MRTVLSTPELTSKGVIRDAPEKATAGLVEKQRRSTLLPTPQLGGSRLRVGIADDHAIVRKGLRELLSGLTDVEVVGEAADGREVMDLARRVQMDVLLMDLAMPKKTGLDALGSLRTQFPDLSVLIFSGLPEDRYALALLRLGAAGFLGKDTAPEDMIKAIRAVGSGKRYWSVDMTSMLPFHLCEEQHPQLHDALTSREFQIFLRLGRGETVGAVGRSLDLSYKTISAHRTSLMRKLALTSNSDLTYYAVKHGLME
ncbi:response regulator transcription factor [Variovorax sp. J22G73]|uniref:response regulator n=1 Tax=unclassified Variovorax TaxID=663243 RepID=UPI002576D7D4|nr:MULTISPECIES: response regulator transcription factor [unclassified Variovorax]MDM0009533.1 response regulator transcription factor [Variovorax sp. J22R203]MDM0102041.1 response regulator transcription factor [Variovorax sp. J22G73]